MVVLSLAGLLNCVMLGAVSASGGKEDWRWGDNLRDIVAEGGG